MMSQDNTYSELAAFGKALLDNTELDAGLSIISDYLKKLTGAVRCSIFVYDEENHTLWTILSTGMEKIVIPADKGIVGHIFMTSKEVIENDVSKNPYFLKEVDKDSGYKTVNMMGCPIYGSKRNIIGVVQLINKLDGFSDKDMQFIKVVLRFIGSFIEVALVQHEKS